jgi:hypothetical protein
MRQRSIAVLAGLLLVLPVARANDAGAQEAGIAGTWRGTYTCQQGVTGLVLRIAGSDDAITARFEFSADASNPGVPSGAYAMTGRYEAKSHALNLRQQRWIAQPPGYIMVDLDGMLSADGRTLAGRIADPSCTTFTLNRADK